MHPVARLALIAAAALAAWITLPRTQVAQSAPGLTQAQREGSLRFAAGTHPTDESVVRAAIAQARPEAQRLVDLVDGAVAVVIGAAAAGAAGTTLATRDGYTVTLDLATTSQALGERGVVRLVLHELGHVVDHALVPQEMRQHLDAAIPAGIPCQPGEQRWCAGRSDREERFAETFAKWATGDIGIGLEIGYTVLPPASLGDWGAPLAALR